MPAAIRGERRLTCFSPILGHRQEVEQILRSRFFPITLVEQDLRAGEFARLDIAQGRFAAIVSLRVTCVPNHAKSQAHRRHFVMLCDPQRSKSS